MSIPDFDILLQQNVAPSDSELPYVEDVILQKERRCANLRQAIIEARMNLNGLVAQAAYACLDLASHKAIIHPVRYLPDEILGEIFIRCVNEDVTLENMPTTLDLNCCPWVLSRVCRRWRDVALHHSRLWATISVALDDLSQEAQSDIEDFGTRLLELQILRSREYPLSIWISCPFDGSFQGIINVLLSTAYRWKFLSVVLGPFQHHFLTKLGPMPLLKRIILETPCACQPSWHGFYTLDFLKDAPQLMELQLYSLPYIEHRFHAPWSQLKTIILDAPHIDVPYTFDTALFILTNCPQLHTFEINASTDCLALLGRPIEMKDLESLTIRQGDLEQPIENFLNNITVPSMTYFCLECLLRDFDAVIEMIKRSKCSITEELAIMVPGLWYRPFLKMLSLPELSSLSILSIYLPAWDHNELLFAQEVMPALTKREGHDLVLPELKQLHCDVVMSCGLSAILDMLESRKGESELSVIELDIPVEYETADNLARAMRVCAECNVRFGNGEYVIPRI